MFIIKHKKIFLAVSGILMAMSLVSMLVFGLNIGIDFKGGALVEVAYKDTRPQISELENALDGLSFGSILLQPTGDLGYLVKLKDINEQEHQKLLQVLSMDGKLGLEETNFNSIGPSVGRELTRKAILSITLVSLTIIAFIAFAFRKVSEPVSSWKYGLVAIGTLLHDVILPLGLFVFLSNVYGAEVDTLFVVAVLTILGLSLSDTIVIFDRIRENLKDPMAKKASFAETVGHSLDQSYARSIATSVNVILVLLALFFVGPESTRYFTLMLTAGMLVGTYSSICLASPVLVMIEEHQRSKKA